MAPGLLNVPGVVCYTSGGTAGYTDHDSPWPAGRHIHDFSLFPYVLSPTIIFFI